MAQGYRKFDIPDDGAIDIPQPQRYYQEERNNRTRSFTGFLKAVRQRDQRTLENTYQTSYVSDRGSSVISKSSMIEGSGVAGGYLVPQDYTTQLMRTFAENSFIYPRAHVVPMASSMTIGPRIDVNSLPSAKGVSPFFGNINYSWGAEQNPVETEPAFRANDLHAWDLLGYCVVSNQWLWDITKSTLEVENDLHFNADSYLYRLFGKSAAWAAEYAFLNGTGTANKMPLGALNAPCRLNVTRQTAGKVTIEDIGNMASALLPSSWSYGIWLISPTTMLSISQLQGFSINRPVYDEGGNGNPSIGGVLTLPVYVTEKLPAVGTPGDVVLIDPSLYVIGDRQQVLIDVSEHPNFRNNQTLFRIWLRLDGWPMLSSTITLQDTTTVVSSVVVLN